MGGTGSGTWHRANTRATLDDLQRLDIRWLQRYGYVPRGAWDATTWPQGTPAGRAVGFSLVARCLILRSSLELWGGTARHPACHVIPLAWTPCHFGSMRVWMVCPCCRQRCAVLYLQRTRFVCRHCAKLPYGSHYETAEDRRYRKVRKIRKRLGASGNLMESIWPWHKPKGMHWRTWERLCQQEATVHAAITAGLAAGLARLKHRG